MKKTERIDKILSRMGYGTRSEIKRLVKSRLVEVNGRAVKDSGQQVLPYEDKIVVNGEMVKFREFIYLMMNKPQEVISATEDHRERTVLDLLEDTYLHFAPFPVGRLDKDTEGLLLLTNDGKLAHELLSPRKHVPKMYYAEVVGRVNESDQEAFSKGVTLDDGYVTMPAKLSVLNITEGILPISGIELTISEGKFHQVKRMFQAVGKKVVYLKRLAMGSLVLDEYLLPGEYRELSEEELRKLKDSEPLVL